MLLSIQVGWTAEIMQPPPAPSYEDCERLYAYNENEVLRPLREVWHSCLKGPTEFGYASPGSCASGGLHAWANCIPAQDRLCTAREAATEALRTCQANARKNRLQRERIAALARLKEEGDRLQEVFEEAAEVLTSPDSILKQVADRVQGRVREQIAGLLLPDEPATSGQLETVQQLYELGRAGTKKVIEQRTYSPIIKAFQEHTFDAIFSVFEQATGHLNDADRRARDFDLSVAKCFPATAARPVQVPGAAKGADCDLLADHNAARRLMQESTERFLALVKRCR
jgi:hypothetical protein